MEAERTGGEDPQLRRQVYEQGVCISCTLMNIRVWVLCRIILAVARFPRCSDFLEFNKSGRASFAKVNSLGAPILNAGQGAQAVSAINGPTRRLGEAPF